MRPPVRYAASGAVRVACQVTGTGPIDIVWAPGAISHLDVDWEQPAKAQFIDALSSFTRLIRFDERGTGLSDRPTDAATLEERTDDIRAVIQGVEVDRAGDGLLASFDGPTRAIRAAARIRVDAGQLGILTRAGIHTGVIERVGDGVRGLAVHVATRIAALARPGEILVSGTVRDLIAGSGIELESRGRRALKGVPDRAARLRRGRPRRVRRGGMG